MAVTVFTDNLAEVVAPGVVRSRLEPGGKAGPDGAVRDSKQFGGATWSQMFNLRGPEDSWGYLIPDIRMAANQIWPLHWHDCWTAVVLVDGVMEIGDWRMERGDVLIAGPGVEYGPLVVGPEGVQILEVFARDILSPGGYGEEYRDHPTLRHVRGDNGTPFVARPPASPENGRRQSVPVDDELGLLKGRMDGNMYFDLGEPGDPERGAIFDRTLSAGAELAATTVADRRAFIVFDGQVKVGGTTLVQNDVLLVDPDAKVPAITAGPDGAHLLEFARTAAAITR